MARRGALGRLSSAGTHPGGVAQQQPVNIYALVANSNDFLQRAWPWAATTGCCGVVGKVHLFSLGAYSAENQTERPDDINNLRLHGRLIPTLNKSNKCNDGISFSFSGNSGIKFNLNFRSKMRFYNATQKTRGTQPDLEFKAHDNYFYLAQLRV